MSSTNRGSIRRPRDYYPTPHYTIQSLINVLDFSAVKTFLEPCKGDGRILTYIPNRVHSIWCELAEGVDYLKEPLLYSDLIITNPPFSLAKEFITKSLQEAKSVWYLLRISYLESLDRVDWWQGKEPTHLLALSARPSFINKGTDSAAYAWFGWDKLGLCKLSPGIHVLPYKKSV